MYIFRDSHSASESGPCHKDSGTTVSAVFSALVRLSILKVTSSLSILQGSQGARGPQGITGPKGTTVSVQSPGPGPGQFVCIPTWRGSWGSKLDSVVGYSSVT